MQTLTKKINFGMFFECFRGLHLIESVKIFVGDEVVPDYSGQTVPDKLALQKEGLSQVMVTQWYLLT